MRLPRPLLERPRSAAARRYRASPRPPGGSRWRAGRYAVVDLETTGLDPRRDEIISWAVVPVDGDRIPAGDARYGLARPARMPDERSIVVHGILPADLAGAPPLDDAADALCEALAGRTPVAHAAWFEQAFLCRALARRGVRLRGPFVDTAVIGRLWLYHRDGHLPRAIALATLARALRLPAHRPHHALGDALTTAQAFLAIATHLDARAPETIGSLAAAARRIDAIRHVHGAAAEPWTRPPPAPTSGDPPRG